jgi:hypothetical protein
MRVLRVGFGGVDRREDMLAVAEDGPRPPRQTESDRLEVLDRPWLRWVVNHLGGRVLNFRIGFGLQWSLGNALLCWSERRDHLVVALPVTHGCDIAAALWGDHGFCWHGDPPVDADSRVDELQANDHVAERRTFTAAEFYPEGHPNP